MYIFDVVFTFVANVAAVFTASVYGKCLRQALCNTDTCTLELLLRILKRQTTTAAFLPTSSGS